MMVSQLLRPSLPMASCQKTMLVVAPWVLGLSPDSVEIQRLTDTGVLGGIIAGIIAASMFNRFYRIKTS